MVRHVLDEKNKGAFTLSNPLSVAFKDAKKFDVQNPIIRNLLSQVNANQIGEKEVKELFSKAEDEKIRRKLDSLRRCNDDDGGDCGDECPGPPPPPPIFPPTFPTQQQRPILPPRPPRSLPQQTTLDDLFDEEGGFFGTESLDVRTNFWNNNNTTFQTSFKNPLTSLTEKRNNVIEMVPRVKEKTEPEEITFSEELNRLFPEANEKIAEQEEKIDDLPLQNLVDIFSKIDKGEIPKELNIFCRWTKS